MTVAYTTEQVESLFRRILEHPRMAWALWVDKQMKSQHAANARKKAAAALAKEKRERMAAAVMAQQQYYARPAARKYTREIPASVVRYANADVIVRDSPTMAEQALQRAHANAAAGKHEPYDAIVAKLAREDHEPTRYARAGETFEQTATARILEHAERSRRAGTPISFDQAKFELGL